MKTLAEVREIMATAQRLIGAAHDALMSLRAQLPPVLGDDTAFTTGRALGLLDNARLKLERDIAALPADLEDPS